MENTFHKYFAKELTPEEEKKFLSEVSGNIAWKEEFMEDQRLMALMTLLPRKEDDEKARRSFQEFMLKSGKR